MITCKICGGNNPDDAKYCIMCSAILAFTDRAYTEATKHLIDKIPSTSKPASSRPIFVTREEFNELRQSEYFHPVYYIQYDWVTKNGRLLSVPKEVAQYFYRGREVIVIDE